MLKSTRLSSSWNLSITNAVKGEHHVVSGPGVTVRWIGG